MGLKTSFSKAIQTKIVEPVLKLKLGRIYSNPASRNKYITFKGEDDYVLGNSDAKSDYLLPHDYWHGYGNNVEAFYESGKVDAKAMHDILMANGYTDRNNQQVLDLGCGAARMLSNLDQHFTNSELWGLDIDAKAIYWNKQKFGHKANFAVTTLIPNVAFADEYFNLVYCGSVFTHIDDLAETWMLELRRVLKKDGIAYITIADESTIKLLQTSYKDHWFAKFLNNSETYQRHKNDYGMMVIGRDDMSQVLFTREYFRKLVKPCFDVVNFVDGAYGYQSAAILRKK